VKRLAITLREMKMAKSRAGSATVVDRVAEDAGAEMLAEGVVDGKIRAKMN
jgi:hypothetical protein